MFYGAVVKASKTVQLECEEGEVLHLSQACLSDPRDGGKTYLKINNGETTYTVCCLQKDKCEHSGLDLFIQATSGVSFIAEGKNDIHLVGYWEPHPDHSDDDDELGMMGEGESEEEDDADDVEHILDSGVMDLKQRGRVSVKGKAANVEEILDEDDENDDLSGSDVDDEDEDDEEDEIEAVSPKPKAGPAGASANKQKPGQPQAGSKPVGIIKTQPGKPQVAPQGAPSPKAKGLPGKPAAVDAQSNQKRKPTGEPAGAPTPQAKQAKAAATSTVKGGADAGGDAKFQQDLTDFLTKNGRTSMSELGSKVKKPAGVAKKLQQFLKDRTNLFKVENGQVELVK